MNAGYLEQTSEDDFNKARTKALLNEIQHFLDPEETAMLSFNDIKKLLKPRNEVYLGMKVVPLKYIVGSEGRYRDFDNHFFPKNMHLKNRWEKIDRAHLSDVILPPVTLYEIGSLYFVRDGNHRVSVARMRGIENIDAEVISLQSEIKLKPVTTKRQLLKEVIEYEKKVFYTETNFGDITEYWDMNFSTPGQYDVLYQHILIHKYYINQTQSEEIPLPDAILSWYTKVYMPVINAIQREHILRKFKNRTLSDMYVWVIKYWDDLKNKYGQQVPLDKAASDFKNQYAEAGFMQKYIRRIKSFIHS
ncbi:MAG: hypothetical protein NC041_00140 [Bacteroides sp.]|nr:hypothetical protein [Prevotella sp.]MCM1407788.1 transcriptional regulator [Treponema brennaborense]MCM1468864.1 hypothetical protein [Bacteroides sp.]